MHKIRGGAGRMGSAAQITQAVQPLDGQRHARKQPSDQQAVGGMLTDMLQIIAVLSIIEPLVLNFPSALSSVTQHPTADFFDRGIGEPERFNDLTESLVALGLLQCTRQGHPRDCWIETFRE
jgi:hypothetical protein